MTFPRPCAVQRYHIVIHAVELDAAGEQSLQVKRILAAVLHFHRAGYDVNVLKYAVLQDYFKPAVGVLADKVERGHFIVGVGESCGQPFELTFALIYPIVFVVYLTGGHSELVTHLHTGFAEISHSACGELYRRAVKGVGSHSIVDCGNKRFAVRDPQIVCKVCLGDCSSVVEVE